jgi:acyl carrier protein
MTVGERVRTVVAQTFNIPIDAVDDETTPAAVAAWDSLGQLALVNALEQEFAIEFVVEDIARMNSVGEIRSIVETRDAVHH